MRFNAQKNSNIEQKLNILYKKSGFIFGKRNV